jgi:sugar O-acyltransferase (sialic acid O-acetyltransferase NeuD family)
MTLSSRGSTPLVIAGAGGHASDLLNAIEAVNAVWPSWTVAGVLADDPPLGSRRFSERNAPHLGGLAESEIEALPVGWAIVIGVGSPTLRRMLADRIGSARRAATVVHPRADIASGVELGDGAIVLSSAVVSANARLGRHVSVSQLVSVGHEAMIGDCSSVLPGAIVSGDVTIGCDVLVGSNAFIKEGLTIGDGARVGAGAVVIKSVPAGVTVVGSPARPVPARP